MSIMGQQILSKMREKGLSLRDLSKLTDIPSTTIQRYITGEAKKVPIDRAVTIARALGLPEIDVFDWDDNAPASQLSANPGFKKRPRLGVIACGQPILAVEEVGEYDEVPSFVNCDYTLVCKGDSMIGAGIRDGDVVYIRQQEEVEQGQIAAVLIDGEVTLKHVYYTGATVTLAAENPAYPPIVCTAGQEVRVLGLMMGYTHMVIRG